MSHFQVNLLDNSNKEMETHYCPPLQPKFKKRISKLVKKAENEGDDSQVEDEEEENVIDEIIVGKGLGNALKVLRDRGILGKTHIRGRNMDKTLET